MKVLLLSPQREAVMEAFEATHDTVTVSMDRLSIERLERQSIEFIVSYGYRHIIRRPILEHLPGRIINLHMSLLPWNRGADANLWSWVDDTPKGVTIHEVDVGVDTGPILAQREVAFEGEQTLATSYWRLRDELDRMLIDLWPKLRTRSIEARAQHGEGSLHRMRDKEAIMAELPRAWDTSIDELLTVARRVRARG